MEHCMTLALESAAMMALDHLQLGIALVDGQARVQSMNDAARSHFQKGTLGSENGRLAARDARVTQRLRRAIASAARADGAVGSSVRVPSRPGSPALTIVITPASSSDEEDGGDRFVSLLISEPEGADFQAEAIQRNYSLTAAEIQLLSALVSGQRLPEYARRQGISVTTARFHLSALFDKMGERRQVDLIRLALAEGSYALLRRRPV